MIENGSGYDSFFLQKTQRLGRLFFIFGIRRIENRNAGKAVLIRISTITRFGYSYSSSTSIRLRYVRTRRVSHDLVGSASAQIHTCGLRDLKTNSGGAEKLEKNDLLSVAMAQHSCGLKQNHGI